MKRFSLKAVSLLLVAVMFVALLPMSVFANGSVTNYSDFLIKLKQLEPYADAFSAQYGKDSGELVLNFIRTGVDRYLDGNWATLAGAEITAFTNYVEEQDELNGTNVMDLRDIVIDDFTLPNGNPVDFGHMFGTMNISYVNFGNSKTSDLAGWAGDLCDLLYYCVDKTSVPSGTVDEMAEYILDNCFGVDADDAFGWDDFYGDMDAFYLVNEYKKGELKFSELMEAYYSADLDDADRSAYFLNNRFSGKLTKEEIRAAVYDTYRTNVGIQVLEADRGISDYTDLRQAACYALADYLYSQAEGRLEGGSGSGDGETDAPDNGYYSVFSSTSSIIAPGVTQKINYAMSADGKQMVYYVATVDVNREDLTIMANYKDNDPSKGWGMQRVQDQVSAMVNNHTDVENFTPVVAINGDGFNTSTGKPGGLLVMEGVEWNPVDGDGFFAILKDGTAMIGTKAEYETYKDQIQEGIGAFGATLVKDGKIVTTNNSGRASRTAIGITADGEVVMMVLDGRQEPFSCGGSMAEIAQIMYEAGCVHAVNLDGGGSSTYMSKPEGSDAIVVVNRPSDGYARSVAASLVAVSTAESSDKFDRAIIETEYEYLTSGTSIQIFAKGVNNIGSSAEIPEEAYWTVSDEAIGSITADGVFTGLAVGDVEVNLMLDGKSVGGITLHVVVPDAVGMEETSINAIYGVPTLLPIFATYNNNPVAIKPEDFFIILEYSNAGTIDGFTFTADAEAGYVTFMAGAMLLADQNLIAAVNVNLFTSDEAIFDFDNVTAGTRTLAWIREVFNATTDDGLNYKIDDPETPISFTYKFGLDMTAIEIPSQLEDLVYMLPGADMDTASAWGFLLDLAERVSVLTEVKITVQFDKNVDVDISDIKVINDYFTLSSATIDENNTLVVICNWVDQTQAIDETTANPICILTGIKVTVKDNAAWKGNELIVTTTGTVGYDIYLRASSLYSFANIPTNQEKYGLYPYTTDKTGYEGGTENGAHFMNTYADFEDSMILNKSLRQGWYTIDDQDYYFVDHVPQTGIQYVPAKNNSSEKLFYKFDENGVCTGTVTGVIEYNGDIYYATAGVMATGWIAAYDAENNLVDYYFDPATGKAVDGKQKIDGYNYVFTDHILTQGDLVTNSNGTLYRWAGAWVQGKWFVYEGKEYHIPSHKYYVVTGYSSVFGKDFKWRWHLFDENGVFQSDYNGLWHVGEDTYYLKNGVRDSTVGLVFVDGYYYYISSSNAKAIKNQTTWVTNTHGLIPRGAYAFDEQGRMINPPSDEPDVPVVPEDPDTPVLNGIVEINGNLYYYQNGVKDLNAGVVKLTDEEGKTFYIYVRSSTGTLATGKYWPAANAYLEPGVYDFGEDGRYYPPEEPEEPETPEVPEVPEEPEILNGIVEIDGKYYYCVNGVKDINAGVVKMTDEEGKTFYIYVRSSTGTLATGTYWPSDRNGLLAAGWYDFGEDGRYYPAEEPEEPETPEVPEVPEEPEEPEVFDGIVYIDGNYYYYVNGVKDINAGVVKMTDEEGKIFYIYVRSSTGTLATGTYWPSDRNGLLEPGWYEFDEQGRYYPEA